MPTEPGLPQRVVLVAAEARLYYYAHRYEQPVPIAHMGMH